MENTLEELRKEIDNIDKNIMENFEKRMKIVSKIADFKKKAGLNTYDPNREKLVIEKNLKHIKDPILLKYAEKLLQYEMDLSKMYQQEINQLDKNKY